MHSTRSPLPVVPGFRESVLRARPSGTPKPYWTEEDFEANAGKRLAQHRRRWKQIAAARDGSSAEVALEIGCGAGLDCALATLDGVPLVFGIDRDPALHSDGERAELARRQVATTVRLAGAEEVPPLDIRSMDATALDLDHASVDVIWSRTALEHVQPLDAAMRETARVLRPGGVAHHVIDPYYWLKGCHARGLTEMPWAHARLELDDYERFVASAETRGRAAKRTSYLRTLNRLTVGGWRDALSSVEELQLVQWDEHHSPLAVGLLAEFPDVRETALPGVTDRDLTCASITAILTRI